MSTTVLYNPLAANGEGEAKAKVLLEKYPDAKFEDVTKIEDLGKFVADLTADDVLIAAGGDGTLNRLANAMNNTPAECAIYDFPAGTGNDFFTDVQDKAEDGLVKINDYLVGLPSVTVKGKTSLFLNGIGFGIDGYCCEVGDQLKVTAPGKPINYAGIAIKGMLGKFHTSTATVTVDGETKTFKHTWLVPTMNGRYYGGGMDIAPEQDRLNADHTVSTVAFHCPLKLKTLIVFPSIFKGKHVKHKEMVDIRIGKHIKVEFDRPCALQIDGETVLDVTEYEVTAYGE